MIMCAMCPAVPVPCVAVLGLARTGSAACWLAPGSAQPSSPVMGTAPSSRDQAELLRAKDTRAVSCDPPTPARFTLSRAGGSGQRGLAGTSEGRVGAGTCVVWGGRRWRPAHLPSLESEPLSGVAEQGSSVARCGQW